MRRLCLFYQVVSTKLPAYVYDFIPTARQSQRTQIYLTHCLAEYFKNSFFPCAIGEWNKLNPEICSSGSYNIYSEVAIKLYLTKCK